MYRRRIGAVMAVTALVVFSGSAPAIAAEEGKGTVSTYTEAWHYETVTPFLAAACELAEESVPALPEVPVEGTNPCTLLPSSGGVTGPVSIFAEDTLHVGKIAGTPVAATYLELDMFDEQTGKRVLPEGADITGGTLTLPVAPTELTVPLAETVAGAPALLLSLPALLKGLTGLPIPDLPPLPVDPPQLPTPADQEIGYLQVEQATLVACPIVTDFFIGAEASFDEPPEIDCTKGFAEAEYTAEPEPTFTVDLERFAETWKGGNDPALAIIPARVAEDDGDTWIVSFWGRHNDAPEAKPITAELTYVTASAAAEGGTARDGEAMLPGTVADGFADAGPLPSEGDGIAAMPSPGVVPVVDELDAEPVAEALAAPPSWRTVGYSYAIAWLMPLLLLIGTAVTGRALTKDLTRVDVRMVY